MVTDRQKLQYYKNRMLGEKVIVSEARHKKETIYGARAINAQLPGFLNVHTDDFDIFTSTPEKQAQATEKRLDSAYKGDFFSVQKGSYPHTWKVKSNVTKRTVADYTSPAGETIPFTTVQGNKYAQLSWIKKKIKRNLNSKNNTFRFNKDNEALQRINLYEKNKRFLLG